MEWLLLIACLLVPYSCRETGTITEIELPSFDSFLGGGLLQVKVGKHDNEVVSKTSPKIRHLSFELRNGEDEVCVRKCRLGLPHPWVMKH